MSESTTAFVPKSEYEITGGVISDPLITVSKTVVGEFENNTAAISFTPATALQKTQGSIILETPQISNIYDKDLSQMKIWYPSSSMTFSDCVSEQLESLTLNFDNLDHIKFSYSSVISATDATITIVC